jgi:hypothetical protein
MASILSLLTQKEPAVGRTRSTYPVGAPPPSAYRAQALQTALPVVYSAMQHAGRNPYDWSGPAMGLATGNMLSEYSGALQQAGAEQTAQQADIRQRWAEALQADPDLVKNPAKLIQTAMSIDPGFLDRFKTAMETSKLAQETSRIETLTPAEKALKEAQTTQAGSQAVENMAGAQLKQEQATTAGALRQPEVRLKGAQAGKYEAEAAKLGRETGLLGQESKYRVPAATYSTVTEAMVAQFWPLAQMNLPEELKNNASMLLSDPMTGKPNEAKIRSFLPYEVQQRYDAIKLAAEKNVAAGMTPQEAVQSAMGAAGAGAAPGQMEFRPPVRFR